MLLFPTLGNNTLKVFYSEHVVNALLNFSIQPSSCKKMTNFYVNKKMCFGISMKIFDNINLVLGSNLTIGAETSK